MTQQYRRRAGEPVDVWRVGDGEPPEWAKAWHLYEACRKHPGDTLMRYESGVIDFMLPEAFARDYEPVPADPAPAVLGTPEGNAAVIAELHDLAAQVGMVFVPDPEKIAGVGGLPDPAPEWRCFHCDETFTDAAAAREHFGVTECEDPICGVTAERYREVERLLAEFRSESDPASREFYRLGGEHAQKEREAEQKGYDRGLADAKAHPEELGLAPAPDVREALEAAQWLVDLPDYSGPAMGRAILQLASALARLKGGGDGDRTG